MSWAENIEKRASAQLERIPGYLGYKDKEARRDSDRALREEIAVQLDGLADRIELIERSLADDRNLAQLKHVEEAVQQLRLAANRLRSLSYGYAGLFSNRPIDESALTQLYLFDRGLMAKVGALNAAIGQIESDFRSEDDTGPDVSTLLAEIESFQGAIDTRASVIESGISAERSKAESAFGSVGLEGSQQQVLDLQIGDALSILGDDFLVDAIIDVNTVDSLHRFARLNDDPEQWLWLTSRPNHLPVLLTRGSGLSADQSTSGAASDRETGVARISLPSQPRKTAPAEITAGPGRDSDDSQVLQLEIDGETRSFSGKSVHPDDIETYTSRGK
jgi:hypothetical protein